MTTIEKTLFGEKNGEKVFSFLIKSAELEVIVISYGCIIQSLKSKDKNGKFDDIVTGWNTLDDIVKNIRFTGRAIGRYGNRIANGRFELDGNVSTVR